MITGPLSLIIWAATGLFFAQRLYPLSALPQLFGPVLIVTLSRRRPEPLADGDGAVEAHARVQATV